MTHTFQDSEFLKDHINQTRAFYQDNAVDSNGGFYHFFKDNGEVYDHSTRHLVSSTRFVFNHAMAYLEFNDEQDLALVKHSLDYLNSVHKQANGGYAWLLENNKVVDGTNHCYGLAFVLLANAVALKAGIEQSRTSIEQTWQLLEEKFFEPNFGLYADEYNQDFSVLSPYRGQNANMHMCEALITTFEATGDEKYLKRAYLLAHNMTQTLAAQADGLIWEHYSQDWQVDWQYNLDNPKHLFRPWGFQIGHLTEWAKLLLILNRHHSAPWLINTAKVLFDRAMDYGWDEQNGGLAYGVNPDYQFCDADKYFWVQAESLATAYLLAQHFIAGGEQQQGKHYLGWYDKIWQYSWSHLIDHKYGGWYRILTQQNEKYSDEKSPAGKTDYHTMGACYEVLREQKIRGIK